MTVFKERFVADQENKGYISLWGLPNLFDR